MIRLAFELVMWSLVVIGLAMNLWTTRFVFRCGTWRQVWKYMAMAWGGWLVALGANVGRAAGWL